MPRKMPATKLNHPLNADDQAELDALCAMLEYVEVSLADRFGKAPSHAVRASRTIVRSYFEPKIEPQIDDRDTVRAAVNSHP